MTDRKYDSEDGEFVDFETLDDWQARDKAKDAEIKRLREAIHATPNPLDYPTRTEAGERS